MLHKIARDQIPRACRTTCARAKPPAGDDRRGGEGVRLVVMGTHGRTGRNACFSARSRTAVALDRARSRLPPTARLAGDTRPAWMLRTGRERLGRQHVARDGWRSACGAGPLSPDPRADARSTSPTASSSCSGEARRSAGCAPTTRARRVGAGTLSARGRCTATSCRGPTAGRDVERGAKPIEVEAWPVIAARLTAGPGASSTARRRTGPIRRVAWTARRVLARHPRARRVLEARAPGQPPYRAPDSAKARPGDDEPRRRATSSSVERRSTGSGSRAQRRVEGDHAVRPRGDRRLARRLPASKRWSSRAAPALRT